MRSSRSKRSVFRGLRRSCTNCDSSPEHDLDPDPDCNADVDHTGGHFNNYSSESFADSLIYPFVNLVPNNVVQYLIFIFFKFFVLFCVFCKLQVSFTSGYRPV